MLYQLVNLQPQTSKRITLSYVVDVYTVETSVKVQVIKADKDSPIYNIYTMPTRLLPVANEEVKKLAATITGKEKNPYNKAKKIYDWIVKELTIQNTSLSGDGEADTVTNAIANKRTDSYGASLLFCSLARAAEIPALPMSGVLICQQATQKHYWAEFWVSGFGWVPLDPALGAGAAPRDFNLRKDHASYYFGNMDNQRIVFSEGETTLSQMDPHGRIVSRTKEYAMQNLWEEAVGGVSTYSSLWSDITITGVYVE
jgi:transglutaminase-like putative cysteine protease